MKSWKGFLCQELDLLAKTQIFKRPKPDGSGKKTIWMLFWETCKCIPHGHPVFTNKYLKKIYIESILKNPDSKLIPEAFDNAIAQHFPRRFRTSQPQPPPEIKSPKDQNLKNQNIKS